MKGKQQLEDGDFMENVPTGVNFARLSFPPTKAEIVLCGVRRRAVLHSSYVNDLLFEMQPECTFVQLSPDLPMFIRPDGDQQNDYRGEWYHFVRRGKGSKFFVNPRPEYPRDTILTKARLTQLFETSLRHAPADIEIGPSVIYSPDPRFELLPASQGVLSPDALLSSLLYAHNCLQPTTENPRVVAIGDMPILVQKDLQARALSTDQCK